MSRLAIEDVTVEQLETISTSRRGLDRDRRRVRRTRIDGLAGSQDVERRRPISGKESCSDASTGQVADEASTMEMPSDLSQLEEAIGPDAPSRSTAIRR